MATESIILDGQTLSGEDQYGLWTTTGSLDGWWSSPEPKGENVAREGSDGDFDLPVDYEARYITLTGSLRAKNHDAQHQAINRFTALVRKKARLQVVGHGPAQWADVVRASSFKMEPLTDTYSQWQARIKAPDPRKFGDTNEFTAKVGEPATVFHRGNYDAPPRFVVSGYAPGGYALVVNGRRFNVTQPVVTASPHTIDYDDGRLRIGGAVVHGGLGVTTTPHIPPGRSISVEIVPLTTGTPTAKLTLLDTYI